jgi:signal transduction histidine kinase
VDTVEVAADQYVAEVRDDGVGGAGPGPEASGLVGLSDRLGALGGTLDIISPPSGGTVLRAAVPARHSAGPLPGLAPLPFIAAHGGKAGLQGSFIR